MVEEVEMVYKLKENNEETIRIFGYFFVINNKDKCKIIYKDKEYELTEYFNNIDNNYNNKDLIRFKLTGINHITDMRDMFKYCYSLISLPDISKWNTKNVYSINGMFSDCYSLI